MTTTRQTESDQIIAEIRDLERRRHEAMTTADVDTLSELLGEGLSYTHSDASRDTKAAYIEQVRNGTLDYGPLAHAEHDVIVHGDVVLVFGEMRGEAVIRGAARSLNNMSLAAWVREGGRWRLAAYQPTALHRSAGPITSPSYEDMVDILEGELRKLADVFRGLTAAEWTRSTRLQPVDSALPHWTVLELAGHFDISMGLTLGLIAGRSNDQPARDRTSFFINPRSETAPVVYEYAYKNVADHPRDTMAEQLAQTFERTVNECRATAPDVVGPGYFAPMRLDEFVATRIVEAVVHGIDLTQALDREPLAASAAVAFTASILDDLLARRTVGTRPFDLRDDLKWVEAASGRVPHDDNRLPLIG